MKRILCVALACAALAGCAEKGKESSTEEIQSAIYRPVDGPKLTIFTMVNNRSGAGGHSAILIEGSQSVLFDPAGSFFHPKVPERADVLYGMSPQWVEIYKSAHARSDFRVVSQEIPVTAAQAERALQFAQSSGPVPSAFCASATSGLLRQVEGFENIRSGFYPLKLMEQIEMRPDVVSATYREDDSGNVVDAVRVLIEQE